MPDANPSMWRCADDRRSQDQILLGQVSLLCESGKGKGVNPIERFSGYNIGYNIENGR